jgi:competence protein ComEC
MNTWNKAPLIRPLLAFITGILIALKFPFYFNNILLFSFYILFTALILQYRFSYKSKWIKGLLINGILLLLGYQLTISKTERLLNNHFSHQPSQCEYAYIHITQVPVKKNKSIKAVAEVLAIKHQQNWQTTKGKVLLYLQKDEKSDTLHYGDNLIVRTNFIEVPFPQNPHQFDYKTYLSYRNIYHQTFLKSEDWFIAGANTGNKLYAATLLLRNKLLNIMSEYHITGDEFAVGSALLLGYEDELNQELFAAYSNTGVVHILSVSGLHVGIVYFVFNWMFFFLEKIKKGNVIKAALLIFILWFYAAITGFSPSVLRATTMFTFIVIAQAFNRNTNIYNTLAASAFLLLLINPFIIMDVGFQLSYLAVIGIILFYSKIYALFSFDTRLIDIIWKMTTVSIAAQIATFPLCLYYFHQFPNYFLLANLIAIPISTLIIYVGITFLLVFKFPLIATFLAYIFGHSVTILNRVIVMFDTLPYASISGVYITVFEMLLMYSIIILLFYYFIQPQIKLLLVLCSVSILLLSIQIIEQHSQYHQKKIIVYTIPKTSAIDFISGKSSVLRADTVFTNNKNALSFHLKNNWDYLSINTTRFAKQNVKTSHLMMKENYIQFYNKKIVVLNEPKMKYKHCLIPLKIDYLICSNNCKFKLQEVLKMYNPTLIIFDSSNNKYQIDKWKTECIQCHKAFYSVVNSGAWVVDI